MGEEWRETGENFVHAIVQITKFIPLFCTILLWSISKESCDTATLSDNPLKFVIINIHPIIYKYTKQYQILLNMKWKHNLYNFVKYNIKYCTVYVYNLKKGKMYTEKFCPYNCINNKVHPLTCPSSSHCQVPLLSWSSLHLLGVWFGSGNNSLWKQLVDIQFVQMPLRVLTLGHR